MLQVDTLVVELQRFGDRDAAVFTGFPTTRRQTRERWARAFRIYAAEVIDLIELEPVSPPRATIQATFAGDVETAFFETLRLDLTLSARIAAEDYADAWRAGMRAIEGGTGGTIPSTSTTFIWDAWTPEVPPRDLVDTRRDRLADELTVLFENPALHTAVRLREIAEAFDRATSRLTALSTAGPTITYR